jgi:hypothetical protein
MRNVTALMIGNLLTLITVIAAYGLGAVALQSLLARRVRVLAQTRRETAPQSLDFDAS